MIVHIQTIPHDKQRYDTVGDWLFDEDGNINIFISEMSDWRYEMLVAFHELAEVLICKHKGIKQEDVDAFDKKFEEIREMFPIIIGDQEPGNMTSAPYTTEHVFATMVEQLLAQQLDVDWKVYDETLNNL